MTTRHQNQIIFPEADGRQPRDDSGCPDPYAPARARASSLRELRDAFKKPPAQSQNQTQYARMIRAAHRKAA